MDRHRPAAGHVDPVRQRHDEQFVTPGDVQLWGTPTAMGDYSVYVTVTDADGATATNTFPLRVVPLVQTAFLSNGTHRRRLLAERCACSAGRARIPRR